MLFSEPSQNYIIVDIIKKSDKDQDGKIDFQEFKKMMVTYAENH